MIHSDKRHAIITLSELGWGQRAIQNATNASLKTISKTIKEHEDG